MSSGGMNARNGERVELQMSLVFGDRPLPPNSDPSLDFRRKPPFADLAREIDAHIEKIDELIDK